MRRSQEVTVFALAGCIDQPIMFNLTVPISEGEGPLRMSGSRSFRPNPMKPLWVLAPCCRAIRRHVCAQPAQFVGRLCWPVEEAAALVGGWRWLAPEERVPVLEI